MINPKEKIEELVKDLNGIFKDPFFRPSGSGEFEFLEESYPDKHSAFFVFKDTERDLILIREDSESINDSDSANKFYWKVYLRIFRHCLFAIDTVRPDGTCDLIDTETELPIQSLSIQTIFNEGLERLKTK